MSTPVPVLSYSLEGNTKLTQCRGAFQIPARRQPQVFKEDELQLHFWEDSRISTASLLRIPVLLQWARTGETTILLQSRWSKSIKAIARITKYPMGRVPIPRRIR